MKGDVFMSERLTWNEMKKKYPNQWLGLIQVDMDGANIRSGIVEYIGKSIGELTELQIDSDELVSVYTTPENLAPMGVVGYLG